MHVGGNEELDLEMRTLSRLFFDRDAEHNADNEQIEKFRKQSESLRILVVDDDNQIRRACFQILKAKGAQVFTAGALTEAEAVLREREIDLVLLDLKLPDGGGLTLLERTKVLHPETAVVVMTAFATVSSAVEAMRIGARDYLTKPFSLQELTTVLERSAQRAQFDQQMRALRKRLNSPDETNLLMGDSSEMGKLHRWISRVTFSTHPVLIFGESGTGKDVAARAIHSNGPNANKPFITVDCCTAGQEDLECDLFGRTSETDLKPGLLGHPDGGTLFLDEISELPLEVQAKLARALQEKEIHLAGSSVPLSVRVLAATNRDLTAMVEQGKFRKDLFFRLNVVNVRIPPLRERREDLPLLISRFLAKSDHRTSPRRVFSDDALKILLEYDWPGNIRELADSIDHACAFSQGPVLDIGHLPITIRQAGLMRLEEDRACSRRKANGDHTNERESPDGDEIITILELEKRAILGTIQRLKGDKLLAAKLLGIGKTTLYRKLKHYGIEGELNSDAFA